MTFRSHMLAALAFAAAALASMASVRAQENTAPPTPADLVARQRASLARRVAEIDARARAAARACASTEASLRAAITVRRDAPPDPSPLRVRALQQEVILLSRLESNRQRRLNAAVDRLLLHQRTIGDLDAAIERRQRLPRARRGPLARRDALLAAMLGYRAELEKERLASDRRATDRRREAEATRTERRRVEAVLQAADRAWQSATEQRDHDRELRRATLAKERQALLAEERRLAREREQISGRSRAARARLRRALDPAATVANRDAPALPELAESVHARAGFAAMVDARRALARAAGDEARRLTETASWHRATARYLERCREEGIRLPDEPAFDPKRSLAAGQESEQDAARQRAEAVRQRDAIARAEGPRGMLAEEASVLRARYLDRGRRDGLYPPAPPGRDSGRPEAPAGASDALRRAGHALARAQQAAVKNRRGILVSRARGYGLIEAALQAADDAVRTPEESESAAAFAASLRAVAAHASAHRGLLAEQRRLDLEVESCRSEWIRRGGPDVSAPAASRTWLESMHAWAAWLPGSGVLAALAFALLMVGWRGARIRRPARLGETVKIACGLAALALAAIGLVRDGTAAHALAGTGALGAGVLLWAVPLDLLAGVRLRFDGHGREGQMIRSGDLDGRVVQRGWLASTLVLEQGERARVVRVGNRLLVRTHRRAPAAEAPLGPARNRDPAAPELIFHVTLQSDWMAARQLVSMIGRRHDPRARVRFHLEDRRIRLTLRFGPESGADQARVRLEVAQAIANAPFAEMAE